MEKRRSMDEDHFMEEGNSMEEELSREGAYFME